MSGNSEYIKVSLLLPEEFTNSLSLDAARAYEKIWNLMRSKAKTEIWISDRALSIMARVDYDSIPQVKDELTTSGLFAIKEGQWPEGDKPNICHRYRFAVQD